MTAGGRTGTDAKGGQHLGQARHQGLALHLQRVGGRCGENGVTVYGINESWSGRLEVGGGAVEEGAIMRRSFRRTDPQSLCVQPPRWQDASRVSPTNDARFRHQHCRFVSYTASPKLQAPLQAFTPNIRVARASDVQPTASRHQPRQRSLHYGQEGADHDEGTL